MPVHADCIEHHGRYVTGEGVGNVSSGAASCCVVFFALTKTGSQFIDPISFLYTTLALADLHASFNR